MLELFINSDLARTQVAKQFSTGSRRAAEATQRPRRQAVTARALRLLAAVPSIVWATLVPRSH